MFAAKAALSKKQTASTAPFLGIHLSFTAKNKLFNSRFASFTLFHLMQINNFTQCCPPVACLTNSSLVNLI